MLNFRRIVDAKHTQQRDDATERVRDTISINEYSNQIQITQLGRPNRTTQNGRRHAKRMRNTAQHKRKTTQQISVSPVGDTLTYTIVARR